MSYLSELLSFAAVEKFDVTEELWKERDSLTVAVMNDWEFGKVITECK
ncbi:hypothetical protein [Bacillus sp. B15-48]|nr:hypothetical protein [Bacillus sp. B15-48]